MSLVMQEMTPQRLRAWARYYRARVDVTSAGAVVGALVDAYETIEKLRELAKRGHDADLAEIKQILTEDAG